jgi:transposase-like protein
MARKSDPALAATWRRVVDRYRRSGVSQRQFCEQEGLSTSTLSYWLRKLENKPPVSSELDGAQFIQLVGAQASEAGSLNLVVELPGGVVLRFSGLSR